MLDLLTIADIKRRLPGVSERTLRTQLRQLGCASQIGGKLFISEEQFARFLKLTEAPNRSMPIFENGAAAAILAKLPLDATAEALRLVKAAPSKPDRRRKRVLSALR